MIYCYFCMVENEKTNTILYIQTFHHPLLHFHTLKTCLARRKAGNVLFNDALNTFYLRLYGDRHMVKDHYDSKKRNPLPPHRLLFPINSRIAHTTAFVTTVVEHWLEREIAQWVRPMKDRPDDPSHNERTLLPTSYISLLSGTRPQFKTNVKLLSHR